MSVKKHGMVLLGEGHPRQRTQQVQRPDDINTPALLKAQKEARVSVQGVCCVANLYIFRFLNIFFLITKDPILRNSKNVYNVGSEMSFLHAIILHDMLLKNSSIEAALQGNGTKLKVFVKFHLGRQCFVAWSVRDENSVWVPRKQHRMESGFTMSQAGWQHLVARGSHLGDGKRYVLGLLLACGTPQGEWVGHHGQKTSAAILVYGQPWSSFFFPPKIWFFFLFILRGWV